MPLNHLCIRKAIVYWRENRNIESHVNMMLPDIASLLCSAYATQPSVHSEGYYLLEAEQEWTTCKYDSNPTTALTLIEPLEKKIATVVKQRLIKLTLAHLLVNELTPVHLLKFSFLTLVPQIFLKKHPFVMKKIMFYLTCSPLRKVFHSGQEKFSDPIFVDHQFITHISCGNCPNLRWKGREALCWDRARPY